MAPETQSSGLFSIFVLAIFSLGLFPYTLYKLCAGSGEEAVVQPWRKGKKKGKLTSLFQRVFNKGNTVLIVLWAFWFLILLWVQASVKEMKPFDPFEILGVDSTATDREIKKAYRQLSLKYHPDKNPDPAATQYFAEYISKAYAALTDEVSRQNYEKYGHPDGPQAMNVGVALPDWIFAKDKKMAPLMLIALVGVGILLPLIAVSWYMLSSNRFTGPNNIMQETLAYYFHSKYCVKESQSLVRIPETLVCAAEFITMPTHAEQEVALEQLRKSVLRFSPDLKDKAAFWKRKASVLKAHMLLLVHLEREGKDVPQALQADLKFVLQKSPLLLEEMFKIAVLPRPPHGYGWLAPAVAVVEMQQCLAQALSMSARRPQGKAADATSVLLQLPYIDLDVVKKLRRRKVSSIKELADLSEAERVEALESSGVSAAGIEEISTMLSVLPTVHVRVSCEMEGEEEIMERDLAKCKVRLIVTRPSHANPNFEPPAKGKAVRAYAPLFPLPRDEHWYIMLTDPATNAVLGNALKINLAEAEAVGFERPELAEAWADNNKAETAASKDIKPVGKAAATATKFIKSYAKGRTSSVGAGLDGLDGTGAGDGSDEAGQLVELPFIAPFKAGKYELQLLVMSDSYVGADKVVPVRLRVSALTRAAQEGRDARTLARQQEEQARWASDNESETGREDRSDRGSGSEDEDEGSDYDYDSDETGELESGSDADYDEEPRKSSKKETKGAKVAALDAVSAPPADEEQIVDSD